MLIIDTPLKITIPDNSRISPSTLLIEDCEADTLQSTMSSVVQAILCLQENAKTSPDIAHTHGHSDGHNNGT